MAQVYTVGLEEKLSIEEIFIQALFTQDFTHVQKNRPKVSSWAKLIW